MYKVLTVSDTIRVPPSYFAMELNSSILRILQDRYERKVDLENGVVLKIWNIHDIKGGRVVLGDGAAYYDVKYNVLTYIPETHEVLNGEVTEVMDFGVFINIGPFDGLVHLSQIANDFITFDKKSGNLLLKGSKHTVKKGDVVRAKIVSVSMKPTIPETKIAMTMKGDGLGNISWLYEEEKPKKTKKEKEEKTAKEAKAKKK
ncbi:MAG: DNA-directed RNA polymerase [Candidatus Micrarchaeota archaeon]|nr:DNA-directed RNA polymerase [Candidatus Micrarchaeota archaeon]